jgi:hypothetical protein
MVTAIVLVARPDVAKKYEAKPVPQKEKQTLLLDEAVRKWSIPAGGSGATIVAPPNMVNAQGLEEIGRRLKDETADWPMSCVMIYSSLEAARLKDKPQKEITSKERALLRKGYIAQFSRNKSQGICEISIFPDGSEGESTTVKLSSGIEAQPATKTKVTVGGYIASPSEELLGKGISYATQKDSVAFGKLLSSGLVIELKDGAPVEIVETKIFSGKIKIRLRGSTTELWTVMEAVR